jgi:primosomal protein N' (replication factor Y)
MSSAASSADPVPAAHVVPLVPAWRTSRAFTYAIPDKLDGKVDVGTLVRIPFGGRRVRGIVVELAESPDGSLEEIAGVVIPVPLARPPMVELLDWISSRYVSPKGQTYVRMVPPRVRATKRERIDDPSIEEPKIVPSYTGGTDLLAAISEGRAGTWCLRVALGEDRGSVARELVGAAVEAEGAALVIVPEVRYGSMTLDAVVEGFPNACRVDSAMGEAERSAGWIALAKGEPVGAGGRASVLAPAPALRVIVVDEESHRTYKEDRSPRFDARRVAIERARLQGAVCVLMSAAPSVETGAAARSGAYGSVSPSRGLDRSSRPLIEFISKPTDRAISHELHERIRDTLRSGRQVALLAPISGYARALWCAECRHSVRCPRCEAGMIYGQTTRSIRCPRCKLETPAPDACPTCGAHDFKFVGSGSERLSEQLAKSFPRARVVRMDPGLVQELERGKRIEADIYVTTWVGTKEAIRPEVGLVGVLDADALIRRPDFRSSELSYQALVEMAEWAGSAASGNRLLIQTDEVGHHVLQAIARNDYSFFLDRELPLRQELGYPPFSELIKVQVGGAAGAEMADRVARSGRAGGARVLGPIEAGLEEKRLELLLKCPSAEAITPALRGLMEEVPQGTRLRVDVDPR